MQRPTCTKTTSGFTLVELMVALLLTGILSVVIYSLFDTTSDNFREVDNLSDSNSQLRFAMDRVRNDIQMAGAQITPDSHLDEAVKPRPNGQFRVAGLITYNGWQDYQPHLADVAANNPHSLMDGIVVMGAYDYPLSFELSGLVNDGGTMTGRIMAHYRGLFRLLGPDPFYTSLNYREELQDADESTALEPLNEQWGTRAIRVTDQQGFMQFLQITNPISLAGDWVSPPNDFNYLEVPLPPAGSTFGPKFKDATAGAQGEYGLDELPEGDTGYDAALVDAYWYYVRQDPDDANTLQLVRERLCAPDVMSNFDTGGGFHPSQAVLGASSCPGAQQEVLVIADNVADFQLWFDCGTQGNDGNVVDAPWEISWNTPNAETDGGCMQANGGLVGQARIAHIRLSLHTENERKSQRHIQFETTDGALCDPDNPSACAGIDPGPAMLRTYDPYPTAPGASQVLTLQADVELPNFAVRNLHTPQ